MGPFADVVIGVTDVGATVAFLELFGFEVVDEEGIDADEAAFVYGLDAGVTAVRLASPARRSAATLLLVPTDRNGTVVGGWDTGPRALDVYTTDLDRTVGIAEAAGFAVSPEATLSGGPMTMRQALVRGPDELPVVFVQSTHRRSSVLDPHPELVHSEPHSVVWVVADHAAEVAWWTTGGWTAEGAWDDGFVAGPTISFSEPSVSDELGLPERPTPITMTMLSDAAVEPVRLELMTFVDHCGSAGADGEPARAAADAGRPLEAGVFALGVDGGGGDRTRLVRSPGGVRVVLRP